MGQVARKVIGVAAIVAVIGSLGLLALGGAQTTRDKPKPEDDGGKAAASDRAKVTINGRAMLLELALDPERRFRGLSGRNDIPADGGMLFVIPDYAAGVHGFVMRDCAVPIDIIYLDGSGRILSFYEMKPEAPRAEDEKTNTPPYPGAPAWTWTNAKYEARLKQYSSRYPAQFAIELKGGTIAGLGLKEGQKVELDTEGLKRRAK